MNPYFKPLIRFPDLRVRGGNPRGLRFADIVAVS